MAREQLQAWLIARIAETRGLDPRAIDARERFSRYGLDSLGALRLVAELSTKLARPLSPTLLWEHPTIEALSRHLSEGALTPRALPGTQEPGRADEEPIAVIGMACRFPGAPNPQAFWRLLCEGVDAVGEVPKGRWNGLHDRTPPGDKKLLLGGFLDQVDGFEPMFFGISPREAAFMDPQQRLMLELGWEALEDAGIVAKELRGSRTGVFFGAIWDDYAALLYRDGARSITPHTVTGHHRSIIANRVSYTLGLRGPSMTVDSACSSALVTVHLGCESLRRGESELVLAGGVNLNIIPESTIGVDRFGGLSPDGRCFTFDARANGYVRGEGGGVVVLKRLSRAIADGDFIHCVIRGSAVNNDGESNGLTAPSPVAQEEVLRLAVARAGVDPADLQYVELHGTGTQLGDPIEAKALGSVFGKARSAGRPLRVGSAKTNIGHLEGAAGIVGLLKVALCLEHRQIPPSLHFETPNPHIPFSDLNLEVQRALSPWPEQNRPLLAGVSSFGLGGTNAHAVLEGWEAAGTADILPLSADSAEGLRAEAQRWLEIAASAEVSAEGDSLSVLCARAAAEPHAKEHRLSVTARSRDELAQHLRAFLDGEERLGVSVGRAAPGQAPGVVFVFAGQGAQWFGMGRRLLSREPVFRSTLTQCSRWIQRYLGWSLLDELTADRAHSRLDEIDVSLPAIISIEIAIAAQWRAWGIEPAAVVGHSTGEIAAAHVAGALSLEDAMRTICAYGRSIRRLRGQGVMGVVGLSWEEAAEALVGYEGRLFRAIQHSAEATVLAGDPDALDSVFEALRQKNVFCRRVAMDVSPHCPLVDGLREELFEALREVRPRKASIPIVSEVTGATLAGERFDAAHWVRNFGDPAFFSTAIDHLLQQGSRVFLEVSPHPLVLHAIESNLRRAGLRGVTLASLRREEDERGVMLDTLGALYALGASVRWKGAEESAFVLPLSAKSPEALVALARAYRDTLAGAEGEARLRDIAFTASARRSHHEHRIAVVGRSHGELAEALEAFTRGEVPAGLFHGKAPLGRPKVVFVFPGQGSQWLGMGQRLLDEERVFREAIEACDQAIQRESGFSVLFELRADEAHSRLGEIDVVQPVLFAIEVALSALWRSWGVEPDAVVGHSMGEVAAAHVAGALTLEDAAKIICRRSRLLKRVSGQGAMGLVELTLEQAKEALSGYEDRLSVAVSNGPRATVLAGDPAALEEVLVKLEGKGVFCRRVKVDVASHSPQMEALRADLLDALGGIAPKATQLAMRSTVTGELLCGEELSAGYWADNLRQPVLFSQATQKLIDEGHTLFLEMSPHPILLPSIEENLHAGNHAGAAIASLRRQSEERRCLLSALGALYVHGYAVSWERLYPEGGRIVSLPTYPWQRERYWIERGAPASATERASGHPLLGASMASSLRPEEHLWEQPLCVDSIPLLADHRVQGEVVFPAAGYVEMALAAGSEALGAAELVIEEMSIEQMLALSDGGERLVQTVLTEEGPGQASFQIASRGEGETTWQKHATGKLRRAGIEAPSARDSEVAQASREGLGAAIPAAEHYRRTQEQGLAYGPAFQGVVELWAGHGRALGRVRLPEQVEASGYEWHPALLDACLQISAGIFLASPNAGTHVPVSIERVRLHRQPGREVWVWAALRSPERHDARELVFDLRIQDEAGAVLGVVEGLHVRRLLSSPVTARDGLDACVYEVAWRRVDALPNRPLPPKGAWLVFVDQSGVGASLHRLLSAEGQRCVRVLAGASYARLEPDLIRIDPSKPEDYRRLLDEAFGEEGRCLGAVHLFSLDARPTAATTPESLDEDLLRGSVSATNLAQALVRQGWRDIPRLWLVTRGVQSIGPGSAPVSVAQAPLWGLGRTIALEHPELRCTRLDLDGAASEDDAPLLLRELAAKDHEDQIVARSDGRYVARVVRSRFGASEAREIALRADGSYLITGGLGGLGLVLARWMVERGARRLALVGRRGPSAEAKSAIAVMEEAGARVLFVQADVSQAPEVDRAITTIEAELGPLRGVVHAAAVLDDHTLLELSESHFLRVFAPKARGAWNLHARTQDRGLDFFLMYSSAATLFGSPGQGNYAAANALLDALSRERERMGLPTMSVQWGAFAEVGLAAATQIRGERISHRGIRSFTPEEGLTALERLFERPRAEIGVVRFEAPQWIESYPHAATVPFFAELRKERRPSRRGGEEARSVREALGKAAPAQRFSILEAHVLEQVGSVLRLSPTRIERSAPLSSLGVDSLMSLEIRNRLEASLGLRLSATILFTYPNAAALAEHLLRELGLGEPLETAQPVAPVQASPRGPEPIAIIGMALRLPGGASTPESFLKLLEEGTDTISRVPAERFRWDSFGGDESESALVGARWGAFLQEDVSLFDAAFFGISPREAQAMDPQQRLLLEVAWEALERAGQPPDRLVGSRSGVFLGMMTNDYAKLLAERGVAEQDVYAATGNGHCFPAGRLSYVLGLTGPSMTVDTACSSSLVAIHLGCQSLRSGESSLVLAGGVNLMLSASTTRLTASTGALSPEGRCKAFDASANGFVRGEGCGVVVLKRLSEAERDGDPILAVIRGSAVNQDGRSTGLTAPNVLSQQELLRQALESSGATAEDIAYVETHGTGTSLGDPIEFEALKAVLGKPRADGSRVVLGALKSNMGHLEAAAGVAGLIKAVLCLQHEVIPRNLHFETLNPRISLTGTPFAIPTETAPWEANGKPRCAGVSSFGLSGTNAHVILEEAPRRERSAPPEQQASSYLLPLSAKSPEALVALARAYREALSASEAHLHDIAFTASVRRSQHEHRLALVGRSPQELAEAIEAFVHGESPSGRVRAEAALDGRSKVVFVFPGQGSQWLGMGRTLLDEERVFREAIEACDQAIQRESGFSVLFELRADEAHSRLGEIDVVQPVLFAIEVALSALWRSWGVEPDAVVGHSMGEVAAAHVAGALTLKDAAKIICRRSRLLKRVSGQGAMGLVELTLEQAKDALSGYEDRLSVAVSNGPRATVLAGDPAALEEVLVKLEGKGVFCRRVKVDVASHSPQMDALRADLLAALGGIAPKATQLAMRSTVTGELLCGEELSAGYWADNLRQPVLFSQATQKLIDEGHPLFLEMSPHPILLPSVEENLREKGRGGAAIASLRRQSEERRCLLSALGELYVHGHAVDWQRLYPEGGRIVSLPTYPWQRERYWIADPKGGALARTAHVQRRRSDGHPFLGPSFTTSTQPGARFWEITIDPGEIAYLSEHRIQGAIVLPGAAYMDIVLSAANDLLGATPFLLEELALSRPMVLQEGTATKAELSITREGPEVWSFRLSSLVPREQEEDGADPEWALHVSGRIRREEGAETRARLARKPLAVIQSRCATEIERQAYYDVQRAKGLELGPAFQGIAQVWRGEGEALARLDSPPASGPVSGHRIHPALLDAALQVLGAALWRPGYADDALQVLAVVRRLRFCALPEGEVWSHAWLRAGGAPDMESREGSVALLDREGRVLVELEGIRLERLERPSWKQPTEEPAPLLSPIWHLAEPLPAPGARAKAARWLLFAEETPLSDELEAILRAHGDEVVRVEALGSGRAERLGVEVVDPASPEAFQHLLKRVFANGAPCKGVIDLWGVEAPGPAPWTMDSLDAAQTRGCGSALHLVQALASAGVRDAPRLFLVTRGTQWVDSAPGDIDIAQAPLWGLGRTIALEHPELRGARIDLDPDAITGEAESLAREILADSREDEVALRQGRRYVGRLGRAAAAGAKEALKDTTVPVVRADATYMITGGLGGLGLLAAQWLAGEGAKHLLLVGRSGVTTEAQVQAIDALKAAGVEVVVARGDIADPTEVASVLREAEERMPPLRGILHTAGVLEDGVLLHQDMRRFRAVFAPKVLGAWNLHVATQRMPLDFFVLYGSMAGLLGTSGLGNYVAANVFLDALSHHRRRLGLPSLSVDWGLFAGVGMGLKAEREGRLTQQGLRSFTPEEGRVLFQRLLRLDTAQVGAAFFDARQWIAFHPAAARSLRLSTLVQESRAAGRPASRPQIQSTLREAAPAERRRLVEQFVKEQVAGVLRMDASRIQPSAPLRNLGIDSIMGLELRNRLESGLGLHLSATLIWTYPTVTALAEHLAAALGSAEEAASSAPSVEASTAKESVATHDAPAHRIEVEGAATPDAEGEHRDRQREAASRIEALESARNTVEEPIAIIGMALRLPGGVNTPEGFFRLLAQGVDTIREAPRERFGFDPSEAVDAATQGARWGAFLHEDVSAFDASFFGISPHEAQAMDPQQRLLLEVTWEALERAGQDPARLEGRPVGVFLGLASNDYAELSAARGRNAQLIDITGNGHAFPAGRLSYAFGFRGPSMVVDTACSSSLVAVDLACHSLRRGESALAVVGGVNLMLSFSRTRLLAGIHALSPDGRCKTFDASANGFVRGEGCGVVVLKRLSEAERDGDPILAVIRGSAVNQDGRSTWMTAPNVLSQEAMLRQALKNARVSPDDIGYVETHGTGTSLGDPIEFEALKAVLGKPRADGSRCVLGAVKTNLGHLEAAAGMAALLKAVLCLQHEAIPRNLHFEALNPQIELEGTPFMIPTETVPWEPHEKRRFAGVSSFGMSGTNAHVILEEAPRRPEAAAAQEASAYLLPLSAKSPEALVARAMAYREALAESEARLHDIAFTASVRRGHHEHRLAVVGSSKEELGAALEAFARGEAPAAPAAGALALEDVTAINGAQGDERRRLLSALGALYVRGHAVAWERLYPEGGRVVPLPTHPWQRERYWIQGVAPAAPHLRGAATAEDGRAPKPAFAAPRAPDDISGLRAELEGAGPGERRALLTRFLTRELTRLMQLETPSLDGNTRLGSLGLDSLKIIELKNRVQLGVGVALPGAILLRNDSIDEITSYLLERLSLDCLLRAVSVDAEAPGEGDDVEVLEI
uniref:Polyketide synthase n=1 Tax=Racemicystis crocea TaxID=1707966 RepID=A0A3S7V0N1_9BACT|nr:hypothetical protein [Racemicystis crocea]